MDAQPQTGFVLWLTGMQGAGKTSLARFLHQRLALAGRRAEIIDADEPGEVLTGGLGPGKDDRDASVRRVGFVAKMLARNGVVVICASLSPYREAREALRREARRFVEVFVDCPMETLQQRSSIYRKAIAGEVRNVAGVDDPYEPPTHAEVVIHSEQEAVEAAAMRIFQALVDLKYVGPTEFGRLTGGRRPKRARPPRKAAGRKPTRKASAKAAARAPGKARSARR